MKRQIIKIDEEKCNGCGECIPNCPEGALLIIDNKARLISDLFCDGLGACIGTCPLGAISFEEREAEAYDEAKVMENIVKQGENTIKAHLKHLEEHNETQLLKQANDILKEKGITIEAEKKHHHGSTPCGCPGSMSREIKKTNSTNDNSSVSLESQLSQWPIQLHLINPNAGYFDNADLLVAADCTAFAYADFHRKYLKDKKIVMFCPKLDGANDIYEEKLTALFKHNTIKSVTVLRMEVPCCGGVEFVTKAALQKSGKTADIKVDVISIDGTIR